MNEIHTSIGPGKKYGCVVPATSMFEGYQNCNIKQSAKGLKLASTKLGRELDITWLPAAAETYCVSRNPQDYIFVEIPIVTADFPNRNMDAFPYEVLTEFNPQIGRLTYATFIGKPTHKDHKNQDPTAAKGIIFDATLRSAGKLNIVYILGGFDRTKDAQLVQDILSGRRNGYSMGAIVGETGCSNCKHRSNGVNLCTCILEGKGRVIKGKLVYENCYVVNYIEASSVSDPADIRACSNQIH